MKRFWFEFNFEDGVSIPWGLRIGCGVAAYSYEDALVLINEKVFCESPKPSLKKVIRDVDVSILDKAHILPNMGLPNIRGVWFPLGYSF